MSLFQPCADETCADCAVVLAVGSLSDRLVLAARASDNLARANDRIATALAALVGALTAASLVVVWVVLR